MLAFQYLIAYQPHRATSGRITQNSKFFYTSSRHRSLNRKLTAESQFRTHHSQQQPQSSQKRSIQRAHLSIYSPQTNCTEWIQRRPENQWNHKHVHVRFTVALHGHILEPIYIPRTQNTATCINQLWQRPILSWCLSTRDIKLAKPNTLKKKGEAVEKGKKWR